jgi:RNA polymerase-interacting CarD/CdnL/TRCF family regulator
MTKPPVVGDELFHPALGVLRLVAITRHMPVTLDQPSLSGGIRTAIISKSDPKTVVAVEEGAGEMRIAPAEMKDGIEDIYVLEPKDAGHQIMVRASEALAWGARPRDSARAVEQALACLAQDIAVDAERPWDVRYPDYARRRFEGPASSAEVLRELSRLKGIRPLSFGESRLARAIADALVQELSLATGQSEAEIAADVARLCEAQERMGAAQAR